MEGSLTITLQIPISDLQTTKVQALLREIKSFQVPEKVEPSKGQILKAKMRILNETFLETKTPIQLPGESVNDLESRYRLTVNTLSDQNDHKFALGLERFAVDLMDVQRKIPLIDDAILKKK